jgi:hypothetical protein
MKIWLIQILCSPCLSKSIWRLFGLSVINSIRETVHWHGTGKISGFLNKVLQDAVGYAPDIIN